MKFRSYGAETVSDVALGRRLKWARIRVNLAPEFQLPNSTEFSVEKVLQKTPKGGPVPAGQSSIDELLKTSHRKTYFLSKNILKKFDFLGYFENFRFFQNTFSTRKIYIFLWFFEKFIYTIPRIDCKRFPYISWNKIQNSLQTENRCQKPWFRTFLRQISEITVINSRHYCSAFSWIRPQPKISHTAWALYYRTEWTKVSSNSNTYKTSWYRNA